MCKQVRGEHEALYIPEHGKSCPTEILEALLGIKAQGRPVWKPMHMQPIFRMNPFITRDGDGRAKTDAYIAGGTVGKTVCRLTLAWIYSKEVYACPVIIK